MRRTWVCCPPNGRGTGECRRATVRRMGRSFPAGSVRRRRTVDTEHRRDVLAKEACFANRSGGNRFRRLHGFLYTPEPGALFPKRPSPVRIIFGRNPCTDQKNVLHLHTDSRSSGFAVETVDVAQSVRVTDCGSEGRGFESQLPPGPGDAGRQSVKPCRIECRVLHFSDPAEGAMTNFMAGIILQLPPFLLP